MSLSTSSESSSTRSDIATDAVTHEMWNQIDRMPFDLLSKSDEFIYIEKVMRLVSKYRFQPHDPHMSQPQYTVKLGKLLLTISEKSLAHIEYLNAEINRVHTEKVGADNSAIPLPENQPITSEFDETNLLKPNLKRWGKRLSSSGHIDTLEEAKANHEIDFLREKNETLSSELDKVRRVSEELRQSLLTHQQENASMRQDDAKMRLEYKHLVSRHRRLMETFEKTKEALDRHVAQTPHQAHKEKDAVERLRAEMETLRRENLSLMESRDRAEELCEQRESEALRDMTKLRQLTKDLLAEERSKLREATEYNMAMKKDYDTKIEHLVYQHQQELQMKAREISLLRQELEKNSSRAAKSLKDSSLVMASEKDNSSYTLQTSSSAKSARQRLERENEDLAAEVEELGLRVQSMEEENKKLCTLIEDYESGNEGLLRLRRELTDRAQTVELLEDENAQLRERLNYMEDSLSFMAGLEELCRKAGITDLEINSLRSKTTMGYGEMTALKDEINLLKEEIEWLEKDRRHWMNKVRLQPLMDTRLRLELGLTPEQLKRLDSLVDQMKSLKPSTENEDLYYKDKYFNELEVSRKNAELFNEHVKVQIENAIRDAFSHLNERTTLEATLSHLRKDIDAIKPSGEEHANETSPNTLLKAELDSAKRQIHQFELMVNDNEVLIRTLREKLAAAVVEKEVLIKERDQFRDSMFATLSLPVSRLSEPVVKKSAEGSLDEAPDAHKDTSTDLRNSGEWTTLVLSLRDQLQNKDDFIQGLNHKLSEMERTLDENQKQLEAEKHLHQSTLRVREDLTNQIAVLQEINEEMNEKNTELSKINAEVLAGMDQMHDGKSKELLQKVVLLRRREAKLLSRLRKAIAAEADAAASKKQMQTAMDTTLKNLKDALEGGSSGFVLPRSSSLHEHEKKQLGLLHSSLGALLQGRLFREDSRYLLHLQHVYSNMNVSEEVSILREKNRADTRTIDILQNELDQLKLHAAHERSADLNPSYQAEADSRHTNKEYNAAAVSKWQSECIMWQQKYELCHKRLETKTEEVLLLERDLDTARQEMVDVKDNIRNLLRPADCSLPAGLPQSPTAKGGESGLEKVKISTPPIPSSPTAEHAAQESEMDEPHLIKKVCRLEHDVARLKSVNLGLLEHSLDLQSTIKSLEIELEASKQEVTLVRESSSSKDVTEFVNAAIREHAGLRRQSELALMQVKKLKIQLTATEANYQVAANEATSYKLGAYRLYRTYVEEITGVVDYVRCLQRAHKGGLSPHRAEIMDRRFRSILNELDTACKRNRSLATELSDNLTSFKTLEQQFSLLKIHNQPERSDALERQLLEARTTMRTALHQVAEYEENLKFSEAKLQRMETYTRDLSQEIARLELRSWSMCPFDDASYEKLLHLRDTIFAKTEAPPLAIEPIDKTLLHGGGVEIGKNGFDIDDENMAIREYEIALSSQKELSRKCSSLQEELQLKSREIQRLSSNARELQDRIRELEDQTSLYRDRLEEEQVRSEEREARLRKAHELQTEVAQKASERNSQCLRDMLHRKDEEIHQLQQQLHAERQKYAEQQMEEASRLERFHERMFSENEAVIKRLRHVVQDKAVPWNEAQRLQVVDHAASNSLSEQLRELTNDNIRLNRELQEARGANVVLETQLNQQNQYLHDIVQKTVGTGLAGIPSSAASNHAAAEGPAEPHGLLVGQPSLDARKATDILTGIINNQTHMIETLRQREWALSSELEREKQLHSKARTLLKELEAHQVEQQGGLRLAPQVSVSGRDPELVSTLRSNITHLEEQLRNAKDALEQEKTLSNRLHLDVEEWKKHLESLQLEVAHQRAEVERSVHLASLNQALQKDFNVVREQNEKLITAVSLLKEKLIEEAQRGSESTRQCQQELALARRMGVIQQESMGHITTLDHRLKLIQKELNERIDKEKEALARYEDTQRMVYQLHQNLRHKEAELIDLKHRLHRLQIEKGRGIVKSNPSTQTPPHSLLQHKGTQVLASDRDLGPTAMACHIDAPKTAEPVALDSAATPTTIDQSAAQLRRAGGRIAPQDNAVLSIAQKARKMEFDNLHSISELRRQLARTEQDLMDAKEQLQCAQESNRQIRQQLQSRKKEMEELVNQHACEVSRLRSLLVSHHTTSERKKTAQLTTDAQHRTTKIPPTPSGTEPTETVKLNADSEPCNDVLELRHKLQVEVPLREGILHRRIQESNAAIDRLVAKVALLESSNPEDVRRTYSVPCTVEEKTLSTLQDELLQKDRIILDLRFTQEGLNSQIAYLQHRIMEYADVDAANKRMTKSKKLLQEELVRTQRAQQNQMESMVATIENLRVLIQHLQGKNTQLSLQAFHKSRYNEALSEVRRLRGRLSAMQENFLDLLRASSALVQPTTTSISNQLPKFQQKFSSTQTTTKEVYAQEESIPIQMQDQSPRRKVSNDSSKIAQQQQCVPSPPALDESILLPRLSSERGLTKRSNNSSRASS